MYNHLNQYRCIIVRGKSKKELDNLLPLYALIIDSICPCPKELFEMEFNSELAKILHGRNVEEDAMKKTLDNHRTEIAGKLFGMYYISDNKVCYASERTKKLIADSDQPAFFKDICFKMQMPNGMNKIQTVEAYMNEKISLRQFPFIVKVLMLAKDLDITLNVDDIGYYILNALDVLTGKATAQEVIAQIKEDKKESIQRKVITPGKATSYSMQHVREQLYYLELANIIYITEDKEVVLNMKEKECIELFADQCGKAPMFDMYKYDLSKQEGRDKLYRDWNYYYSQIGLDVNNLVTNVTALTNHITLENKNGNHKGTTVELGDSGEEYVYNYEKEIVGNYDKELLDKVLLLGKIKGLGYDIQSINVNEEPKGKVRKYIEVKSTKRVTAPALNDEDWVDAVNITRNEWIAAQQYKENYYIYRVYFVRDGVKVYVMKDIYKKDQENKIEIVPLTYRLDFSNNAIDYVVE